MKDNEVGTQFRKGRIPWNKGLRGVQIPSAETRKKLHQSHLGKRYAGGVHWITKTCQACKKGFEVRKGLGQKRKYCSRQCYLVGRSAQCTGNLTNHTAGYRYIRINGKRLLHHRYVVEQALGRPLVRGEVVHHNNGDKADNRLENLTVMPQACHRALVNHLANLWVAEHSDLVDAVTKEFTITFTAGG